MKRIIYKSIFVLLFAACEMIGNDSMMFSLEVENYDIDRMSLSQVVEGKIFFIDSIFKKQWQHNQKIGLLEEGNYFLEIDQFSGIPFYMEEGFNQKIILTGVNRFNFEGKGSDENEYLIRNRYHPLHTKSYQLYSLQPKAFIMNLEACFKPLLHLVEGSSGKSSFWKKAYADQQLLRITAILIYNEEYKKLTGKTQELPLLFLNEIKSFNISDKNLYVGNEEVRNDFLKAYVSFIDRNIIEKNKNLDKQDVILQNFKTLNNGFTDSAVRDKAMYIYAMDVVRKYSEKDIKKGMKFYFEYKGK